jgi:zinc protease
MRMATMIAALLLALPALAAAAAPAADDRAFPFPVEKKTLANGLRLYAVHFDSPGLLAYYTVVRTGSRNEVEPGYSGFAHFFEHMMFRGTEKYPADKYNDIIKQIGADSNAFTSDDLTVYHLLAANDSLPTVVAIEADRFQHLKYSEAAFQKEAGAILGEYNKSSSDPFWLLDEKIRDLAFTTHTYKHTTIGFVKDIEAMPHEYRYSLSFFDRYYRPDNLAVLAVGDVHAAEFFRLAESAYGGWTKGPERPDVPVEPPQTEEKRETLAWKTPTLPIVTISYHVPAYDPDSIEGPALDALAEILFSERSPLYKKLVLEDQTVESLYGDTDPHRDPCLYQVAARVKDPKDLAPVERAIERAIEDLAATPPDPKLLSEVVSHIKYAFAASLQTADRVATTAAYEIALAGDIESINRYFALYDRLTPADVSAVAAKYLRAANRTVVDLKGAEK